MPHHTNHTSSLKNCLPLHPQITLELPVSLQKYHTRDGIANRESNDITDLDEKTKLFVAKKKRRTLRCGVFVEWLKITTKSVPLSLYFFATLIFPHWACFSRWAHVLLGPWTW